MSISNGTSSMSVCDEGCTVSIEGDNTTDDVGGTNERRDEL